MNIPSFGSIPSRRRFLQNAGLGIGTALSSGWLAKLAEAICQTGERKRQCILLWMPGAPSQIDTFDLKPGTPNGGEFKEIATRTTGLRISEHLPKLAEHTNKMAIVRSMHTKEGDHARATYVMRTGQAPGGPIAYPAFGSAISKALGDVNSNMPNYVSVAPLLQFNPNAFSPGFLGPNFAPAVVGRIGDNRNMAQMLTGTPEGVMRGNPVALGVDFLTLPTGVTRSQADRRVAIWDDLQNDFRKEKDSAAATAHDTVYEKALRAMNQDVAQAFDLSKENEETRRRYGTGVFGQGCLLARRLIERGVPFVEVTLDGSDIEQGLSWDTHADNFNGVRKLSAVLDAGWATLMTELEERGLLETTTILWMGEFGRTPIINSNAGRDHFNDAWSCVFAGGGIAGGQAFGKTSENGMEVVENPVDAQDVIATLCQAVGVDPSTENQTSIGRPIKIVDKGTPIKGILA